MALLGLFCSATGDLAGPFAVKVEEITEVEGAVNDIKCVDEIEPSEEQRRKIQKGN